MELVIVTEVAVQLTVVTSQNAKMTEHIMKDPFNSTFAHALKRGEEENLDDKIQNFIAIQNPKFYAKAMTRLEGNGENDQLEKRELDEALSGFFIAYSDIGIDPIFQCDDKIEKWTNQILTFKNENYRTELEKKITEDETENEKGCEILHLRKSDIEQNELEKASSLRIENLNELDDCHVKWNVTDTDINSKCLDPVLLAPKPIFSDICVQESSIALSEEGKSAKDLKHTNDKNNVNPNKHKEVLRVVVERENNVSLKQFNVDHRYTGEEISRDVCVSKNDDVASSSTHYHEHNNLKMSTFDLQTNNLDKGENKEDKFRLIGNIKNSPKWASVIQTRNTKHEEDSKKEKIKSMVRIDLSKKNKNILSSNNDVNSQNCKNSKKEISDPLHDKV